MSYFKQNSLPGLRVLVTGGGSGIGLGIVRAYLQHGASVAIMGRKIAKLEKARSGLMSEGLNGSRILCVPGDVRTDGEKVVGQVVNRFGGLDILVNAAAGNFMCSAENMSSNAFQTVIDIDLRGTFNMCSAARQALADSKSPHKLIINITATLQYRACPFQAHAAAAKAGIDVLTNTLGVEWTSKFGIRVCGVAPGPIAGTEGGPTGRVFGSAMKAAGMTEKSVMPIGRWGEIYDIANTCLFLTHHDGINATTLVVDGGHWHGMTEYFRKGDPFLAMMRPKKKRKSNL